MIAISETEQTVIRRWGQTLAGEVVLPYATVGHPLDDAFSRFAMQLASWAPQVRPRKTDEPAVTLPTLLVHSRVAYQALPVQRELDPFLALLADQAAFLGALAPVDRQRLERLRMPAPIQVYITPHCPFCPAVVSLLFGLAEASDQVRLTVIDGTLFPEMAEKERVQAAPTIILDGRFRWTGAVEMAELISLMLERDPTSLSTEALKGLIETGDAGQLAGMMADHGQLFPAFIELLSHPRWSVRLGAMVALETLAEIDPALAGQVVEPVLARFDQADDTVKGDLLYVLGEAGNPAALPLLRSVIQGSGDPEVRIAAQEAIAKLA